DMPQPFGTVPTDKLCEALSHVVSDLLKVRVEEIDAETSLSEYGFDSITFTRFSHRLNQTYQLDLTPALFYEYSTLERLTQYLRSTYASVLSAYFVEISPHLVTPKGSVPEPMTTDEVPPGSSLPQQRARVEHSAVPPTPAVASPVAIIG